MISVEGACPNCQAPMTALIGIGYYSSTHICEGEDLARVHREVTAFHEQQRREHPELYYV